MTRCISAAAACKLSQNVLLCLPHPRRGVELQATVESNLGFVVQCGSVCLNSRLAFAGRTAPRTMTCLLKRLSLISSYNMVGLKLEGWPNHLSMFKGCCYLIIACCPKKSARQYLEDITKSQKGRAHPDKKAGSRPWTC